MIQQAFEAVFTLDNMRYILQGLLMTLEVAVVTIICSLIFGTILGLVRSYGKKRLGKVLGMLSGVYIEVLRNTPNLLWVFICFIGAPFKSAFARCTFAFILFTSAMVAEIVRGGLNSIAKGQFEAAQSQGFSFLQALIYIIIPQCFQRIIPTLLSQMITVIKDTSFLAQVAVAELLFNTKDLMGKLYLYSGHPITSTEVLLLFGLAMMIYFIINFTLSCVVRRLQKNGRTA